MICISIAQESRKFALVDMLNAAPQCDLLEIRLDRFEKTAEVKEIVARKAHPIIFSCRRFKDGGDWQGAENERLTLLRQCVVSGADYVEIELDVADQIRPYPGCKRIIAYTNLQATPENIGDIYDEARGKQPDVIKLTTLARTPEEAWPLLQIVSRATTPTVVTGLGKPGIMLSILGRRLGAPWTYAALERGMETYPGQPTIQDLATVYDYRSIGKQTKFLGVTGFGALQTTLVAGLNAGLAHSANPLRCLPLGVGEEAVFQKIMNAVKLAAVVVDTDHQASLSNFAETTDQAVQKSGAADLLVSRGGKWQAWNIQCRSAVSCLEQLLNQKHPSEQPLQGRMAVVIGGSAFACAVAYAMIQRGGHVIVADRVRETAHQIAQKLGCRHVLLEAVYSTSHDILVICDDPSVGGRGQTLEKGLHPGYLKPTITVMDLTAMSQHEGFLQEARSRGCAVVAPLDFHTDYVCRLVEMLTGVTDSPSRLRPVVRASVERM